MCLWREVFPVLALIHKTALLCSFTLFLRKTHKSVWGEVECTKQFIPSCSLPWYATHSATAFDLFVQYVSLLRKSVKINLYNYFPLFTVFYKFKLLFISTQIKGGNSPWLKAVYYMVPKHGYSQKIIKDGLKLQRWVPWEDPLEYQEKIELEM